MTNTEVCPIAEMKNILLATDGSEFSAGAVREAIRFAQRCNSHLYVISIVETNPEFEIYGPDVVEKIEKKTRSNLEKIKEQADREGISCETISHRGENASELIIKEAARINANVIIMGRRGRSGIKRLMMGSVTALVIGGAPCNVFVVPRAGELNCRRILVATDGSEYSERAARETIEIAKRCSSSVMVISVAEKEEYIPQAEQHVNYVKDIAVSEGVQVETFAVTGTPYEAISTTAQIKKADLIVVGTRGRTGLQKLLMGSVAERVIALSHCTVLVVK